MNEKKVSSCSSCLLFLLLVLLMKPTAAKAEKWRRYDPSDFLVEGLEEIEPAYESFDGTMYAGLLPIDIPSSSNNNIEVEVRGKLMFWLLVPNQPTSDDSMVIWFNGGPGCTSFSAGALFETSPVTTPMHPAGYLFTNADDPLIPNPYAWTKATTMLYVEQPAGVGFSYGPEPQNEHDVARDFYYFLQNFYLTFETLQPKRLFLFGESYAGMYVPSIARRIYLQNNINNNNMNHKLGKEKEDEELIQSINLAGIALGNGWFDPVIQGPTVIDYAWWHGMIDIQSRDTFHELWNRCIQDQIVQVPLEEQDNNKDDDDNNNSNNNGYYKYHKFTPPDECGIMGAVLQAAGEGLFIDKKPNTYDVSSWDTYPNLNDPNSTIPNFYNNPRVKHALHAPMDTTWAGCIPGAGRRQLKQQQQHQQQQWSSIISSTGTTSTNLRRQQHQQRLLMLDNDKPISVVPYIAELLDQANITVLIYNGDLDMSTNAQGAELALNTMEWSGKDQWVGKKAKQSNNVDDDIDIDVGVDRGLWMTEQSPSGYAKQYHGLQFVTVYNSGHLVPYNQPIAALDLLTRFITNQSFLDKKLPKFTIPGSIIKEATTTQTTKMIGGSNNNNNINTIDSHWLLLFIALVAFLAGFGTSSIWRNKYKGYETLQ